MTIIGIDPGVTGAVAILTERRATVVDIPVIQVKRGKKMRSEYNAPVCAGLLRGYVGREDVRLFLEDVRPRPMMNGQRDSLVSARQMGISVGLWRGIAAAFEIPLELVQPVVWKRKLRLLRTNKEASRARAIELFPGVSDRFMLRKDHNRAEALLIAEYGRWKLDGFRHDDD